MTTRILYDVRVSDRSAGWIDLQLTLPADWLQQHVAAAGSSEVILSLPTWTPGSYLIREYARTLGRVERLGPDGGVAERLTKHTKNRWLVPVAASDREAGIVIRYRLYARECSVRTAFATDDWVFWDGAVPYLWPVVDASKDRPTVDCPATIRVHLPSDWTLVAGCKVCTSPGRDVSAWCGEFDVISRAAAIDTPCLAGRLQELSVDVRDRSHAFLAAGLGGIDLPESFASDLERVLDATAAVFGGELPFAQYVFHALFGRSERGGLEHRDSSVLLAPRTTFAKREDYEDFLGLVSHEYLHVWNVKRMRPRSFVDYDFEAEVYTDLLWVAEGFTAYYDELCLLRAGLIDAERYLEYLVRDVRNFEDNPGRFVQSLAEASHDAWIRLYRADENTRNTTQNYYGNGAVLAFCLDAEIRRVTGGVRCLDDAMRKIYAASCPASGEEIGFDESMVIDCLSSTAGTDLSSWIRGAVHEAPPALDIDRALELHGLRLNRERTDRSPYLGITLKAGTTELATVRSGSPAALAGLRAGDEWLAVEDLRIDAGSWRKIWTARAKPEATLRFLIARDGQISTRTVTAGSPNDLPHGCASVDEPSDAQLAHREAWLGQRSLERR